MDIEELKELVTQSIVEGVNVNDTINGVLKDIDNFESESKSDFEPLVIKADQAVLLAEIKPCPFCGEQPKYAKVFSRKEQNLWDIDTTVHVFQCTTCNYKFTEHHRYRQKNGYKFALQKWNTRSK